MLKSQNVLSSHFKQNRVWNSQPSKKLIFKCRNVFNYFLMKIKYTLWKMLASENKEEKNIYERDTCRKMGNVDQYKLLRNKCSSMVKRNNEISSTKP